MTTTDTARDQAQAQLEHIRELMEWFDHANECGKPDTCSWSSPTADDHTSHVEDVHDLGAATNAIHEKALEIAVRGSWHTVGGTGVPREYRILLCTGGPAVRIIGELDDWGEVESARLEYQDWGTPWTQYGQAYGERYRPANMGEDAEESIVLRYAQQFHFGA